MRRTFPVYRLQAMAIDLRNKQLDALQHRERVRLAAEERAAVMGPPKRRGRPPKGSK